MAKKTKKSKTKSIQIKIIYALIAIGILILFSLYKNLQSHRYPFIYSETKEKTQGFVPSDVADEVAKQKKIFNLTEIPVYKVPILMYHYIEYVSDKNDTIRISLNTLPIILDEQIKTLKEAGYTFMSVNELSLVMNGKMQLPKKSVILTFDDGYRDFYTDAYPILKKHNAKATQYVVSGLLNSPNYMLKNQVKEIAKDGLVEIGAHTVNHNWLKDQAVEKLAFEISQSKVDLENLIKKPVTSFAYPYGAFDQQAITQTKLAGYETAVSTVPGIKHSFFSKYFLFRVRPGARTGQELINFLQSSKFSTF